MPSITTWNRIEPRPRNADFADSLAARVHDALWFLARQWQFREFRGEDGGSAVAAQLRGSSAPLTRVRLGAAGATLPYDDAVPLETYVEREPFRAALPAARDGAEAGLMWLSMLEQQGLAAHRQSYIEHLPLARENAAERGDPASQRFRRVLGRRVPDGAALYAELDAALRPEAGAAPALPAIPAVGPDTQRVTETALKWLSWYDDFADEPDSSESAWVPSRMEYEFSVAAPAESGESVFETDDYAGGRLDWYSFRLAAGRSLGAADDRDRVQRVDRTVTPGRIEIPGNPTPRFWEFEDGRVDLARLETGPEDVARVLLAEYALIFADDWLFVPIDLRAGTVFRTESLEIRDTFGTVSAVPSSTASDAPDERWGFFHISAERGAVTRRSRPESLFLLPPVVASSLDGAPVEEVLVLRDEMANLSWAVERRVPSSRGRALDRGETYQRLRAPPARPGNAAAPITYRMHGQVPDYWFPLVPVRVTGSTRSIQLQRGTVRDPASGALPRPIGRLLVPEAPLFINEEEAPSGGALITRSPQYSRGKDGRVHLWMGRRKRKGCREGWNGIRFDILKSGEE